MADETGSDSGIGMNIEATLAVNISEKQLAGSFNESLNTAMDESFKNVSRQAKVLNEAAVKLRSLLSNLAMNSKSLGKSADIQGALKDLARLQAGTKGMNRGRTSGDFALGSVEMSQALSSVTSRFAAIDTSLSSTKLSPKERRLAERFRAAAKTLETQKREQNKQVRDFGKAQGLEVAAVQTATAGRRANIVQGGIPYSLTDAQYKKQRSKQAEVYGKSLGQVDMTRPMAFDVETANFNDRIWSIALKDQHGKFKSIQRDLRGDKVKADPFHASFVKGLKSKLGQPISEIISQFHDLYTGGDMNAISTQLRGFVGHNLDADLGWLREEARGVAKNKNNTSHVRAQARQLRNVANRFLDPQDSAAQAIMDQNDTARLWPKFMRDELGYTSHKNPRIAGGMGNTLQSMAAAVGYASEAHNPVDDARFAEEMQQKLSTPYGRGALKEKLDNPESFNRWLAQAEKDRFASQFRDRVSKTFGQNNVYRAQRAIDAGGVATDTWEHNSALQEMYATTRARVETEAANYGYDLRANKAGSQTAFVAGDKARLATQQNAAQRQGEEATRKVNSLLFDSLKLTGEGSIRQSYQDLANAKKDSNFTLGESLENRITKQFSNAVNDAFSNEEVKEALRKTSGAMTTDPEEMLKIQESLTTRLKGSYALSDPRAFQIDKVAANAAQADAITKGTVGDAPPAKPSRYAAAQSLVQAQLREEVEQSTRLTPKAIKTQFLTKDMLRASDLAAMSLPKSHPSYRSEASLKAQATTGVEVPITINSRAAEAGDVFERKAIQLLQTEYKDRFELSHVDTRTKAEKAADLANNKPGPQANLAMGGFAGHPDGYMYDKKTGQGSLLEVKYRGAEDLLMSQQGRLPPNYKQQASFYAMASQLDNIPTSFLMGDLVSDSQEIRDLQKKFDNPHLPARDKPSIAREIKTLQQSMPLEDKRVGNLSLVTVPADKGIQKNLLADMNKITGGKYSSAAGVSQDIRNLVDGKKSKISATELNKALGVYAKTIEGSTVTVEALKSSTVTLTNSQNKAAGMTIGEGNAGKGGGGGGGGDTSTPGSPFREPIPINVSREEEYQIAQKQAAAARTNLLKLQNTEKNRRNLASYIQDSGRKTTAGETAYFTDTSGISADVALAEAKLRGNLATLEKVEKGRNFSSLTAEDYAAQAEISQINSLPDLEQQRLQIRGRQRLGTYKYNRQDRDDLDFIRRQTNSIVDNKPIKSQPYNNLTEVKLATSEAEAEYKRFILKLRQDSVAINATIKIAGMDTASLQKVIGNNSQLSKLGLNIPGMSTANALAMARENGVSSSGQKTGISEAFYSSTKPSLDGKSSDSPFTDLLNNNKLAEQTVKKLYSTLGEALPATSGLSSASKEVLDLEKGAGKAIDKVRDLRTDQEILRREADLTKDPKSKAEKTVAADSLTSKIDEATLNAKSEILGVEKAISAQRIDPKGAQAMAKYTKQLKGQLKVTQENLEIERRQITARLKLDNGRHATGQDISRLMAVNTQLDKKFDVGGASNVMSNAGAMRLASRSGIEVGPTAGSAGGGGGYKGRTGKDFVGGAIDLLDWQMQWMAGVAVMNAFSSAVKNSFGFAVQFEAQLQNIKLITQANTVEMDRLVTGISDLAGNFKYSATELGEGLIILGQAGFSASESIAILPSVTALATATMSNLATAMDITTTAIEAFDIPTEKVDDLANALAAITIESKLDIDKLGTSFNYIASTASAAGFSIEETGTAMGLMSNAGVRASTIGTSMRSVIGSLLHPTEKFTKALAEVGLSVDSVSPKTNDLGQIFITLKKAGFDVEKAFAGLDKRIAGGAITLIQAADEFYEFQSKITGTSRAFSMAEGQMDTLAAQVLRLRNSFQLLGGSLFSQDMGPLKDLVKVFNQVVESGAEMSKEVPKGFKSLVNSSLALSTVTSLAYGVGSGLFDIHKNIKGTLATEDTKFNEGLQKKTGRLQLFNMQSNKKRLPGEPILPTTEKAIKKQLTAQHAIDRKDALTGRSKSVYTTFSTFFNLKTLGVMALMTAGTKLFSYGIKQASGELDVLAGIRLKDKFDAEVTSLKELSVLYQTSAKGTTEYVKALNALKALGVEDFSSSGIKKAISVRQTGYDLASEDLNKAEISRSQSGVTSFYASPLFENAVETEQREQRGVDILSKTAQDAGVYWSGNIMDVNKVLKDAGWDPKSEFTKPVMSKFVASRASNLLRPDAGKLAEAEIEASFFKEYNYTQNLGDKISGDKAALADLKDLASYGDDDFADAAGGRSRMAVWKEIAGLKKIIDSSKKRRKVAGKNLDSKATDLAKVKGLGLGDGQSGLQAKANEDLMASLVRLKTAIATKKEDDKNSSGITQKLLATRNDKEIASLEKELKSAVRRQVKSVGLPGAPKAIKKLLQNFVEYVAPDGKVEDDKFDIFSSISLAATEEIKKALDKLETDKDVEIANMSPAFKDAEGKLKPEIKTIIDLKYDIKTENTLNAKFEEAFKPLAEAFARINKRANELAKIKITGLSLDMDNSAFKTRVADSASDFELELSNYTKPSESNVSLYNATKGELDRREKTTAVKQYNLGKRKADSLGIEASDAMQLYKAQGADLLAEKARAEAAHRAKTIAGERNLQRAKLQLELDYNTKALDLAKKTQARLKKVVEEQLSLRAKQLGELGQVRSDREDSKQGFDSIALELYNKGGGSQKSKESAGARQYRYREQLKEAEADFDTAKEKGDYAGMKTASNKMQSTFKEINEDPQSSKARLKAAAEEAKKLGEKVDTSYGSVEDELIKVTQDLTAAIIKNTSVLLDEDGGRAEITKGDDTRGFFRKSTLNLKGKQQAVEGNLAGLQNLGEQDLAVNQSLTLTISDAMAAGGETLAAKLYEGFGTLAELLETASITGAKLYAEEITKQQKDREEKALKDQLQPESGFDTTTADKDFKNRGVKELEPVPLTVTGRITIDENKFGIGIENYLSDILQAPTP